MGDAPHKSVTRMSQESIRVGVDGDLIGSRLLERIDQQGLQKHILELEIEGYTVLKGIDAPLTERIREGILALWRQASSSGRKTFGFGPQTSVLYDVVSEVAEVRAALTHPVLTTLMTYLLGDGYMANLVTGSVFQKGCMAGPIHSDNEFQPEPFPSWASVATAIWCCDEFTEENGATHVVPRSHLLGRHPRPGEGESQARPIMAPAGSIIVWNGATWHSSGARTTPGERVVLHTSFCRLHIRSLMSFDWVPPDLVNDNPQLGHLLGRRAATGFGKDGPDPKAMARAKGQVESLRPWR